MLRDYEFTMVVRPDLSEEDLAGVLASYEKKLTERDGSVLRKDAVGTKRFSYPIKKCFRGYFVNYDISANPIVVKDIEHQIRFDDKVLRHLIIGMDRRKSAIVREEIAAEQKRLAEAQAETAARSSDSSTTEADDMPAPASEETVVDNTMPSASEENEESEETVVDDNTPPSTSEETVVDEIDSDNEETMTDTELSRSEETVVDAVVPSGASVEEQSK